MKPDDNFFHTDSVKVDMAGGTQGKSMDATALINVINQQVVTSLKQLPILLVVMREPQKHTDPSSGKFMLPA